MIYCEEVFEERIEREREERKKREVAPVCVTFMTNIVFVYYVQVKLL